jgi:hypothetical protein
VAKTRAPNVLGGRAGLIVVHAAPTPLRVTLDGERVPVEPQTADTATAALGPPARLCGRRLRVEPGLPEGTRALSWTLVPE